MDMCFYAHIGIELDDLENTGRCREEVPVLGGFGGRLQLRSGLNSDTFRFDQTEILGLGWWRRRKKSNIRVV